MTNYIFSDPVPNLLCNFAVVSSGHKLCLLDLVRLCEHGKAEESPDSISINYIGFKFTFFNHRIRSERKNQRNHAFPIIDSYVHLFLQLADDYLLATNITTDVRNGAD